MPLCRRIAYTVVTWKKKFGSAKCSRFGEGLLDVLVLRRVHAREPRRAALREVGRELNLPHQREHVRVQPRLQQHLRRDLHRLGLLLRLDENSSQRLQHLLEHRNGSLVERNRHL
jgi:hypothetical protein